MNAYLPIEFNNKSVLGTLHNWYVSKMAKNMLLDYIPEWITIDECIICLSTIKDIKEVWEKSSLINDSHRIYLIQFLCYNYDNCIEIDIIIELLKNYRLSWLNIRELMWNYPKESWWLAYHYTEYLNSADKKLLFHCLRSKSINTIVKYMDKIYEIFDDNEIINMIGLNHNNLSYLFTNLNWHLRLNTLLYKLIIHTFPTAYYNRSQYLFHIIQLIKDQNVDDKLKKLCKREMIKQFMDKDSLHKLIVTFSYNKLADIPKSWHIHIIKRMFKWQMIGLIKDCRQYWSVKAKEYIKAYELLNEMKKSSIIFI